FIMSFINLFRSLAARSRRASARRSRPQPTPRRRNTRPLRIEPLEDRCMLSATLVADINPFSIGSIPTNLTDVNGTLFFMPPDGSGRQLYHSDGTEAGTVLVKDFGNNAYVANFTNVNGELFFIASEQGNGGELWESDGTEAGTHVVKVIRPGVGSNPSYLTNVN